MQRVPNRFPSGNWQRLDPLLLARTIAGPEPSSGTDTWFCDDLPVRDLDDLRAERARLRMAAILHPQALSWWHRYRLSMLEAALR